MAERDDVQLRIKATNLTKDAFKAVSEALKALEDQQDQTTSKGSTSWGKLFGVIGGGAAVGNLLADAFKSVGGLIASIPGQLIELGKRGSDVADVRAAFTSLAGGVELARDTLGKLRSAFGHTVTDFDLMKSSNEALRRGVKLTGDDFATLAKGARILADQVGGNAKQSFDSMLSAIGRGNERELKQLGVNLVNIERSVDAHARAIGREAGQLKENEKQHALRNALLDESKRLLKENGDVSNDFADNLQAINTLVDNWTDRLADAIATAPGLQAALSVLSDELNTTFGDERSDQVRRLSGWIDQGTISILHFAQGGLSAADAIGRAWSGLRLVFDSVFSLIYWGGIRTVNIAKAVIEIGTLLPGVGDSFEALNRKTDETLRKMKDTQRWFHEGAEAALEGVKGNHAFGESAKTVGEMLARMEAKARAAAGALDEGGNGGRRFGDGVGAGVGSASKDVESFEKKLKEMAASLAEASRNGQFELWVMKNGSALKQLGTDATLLARQLPEELRKAFFLAGQFATSDDIAKLVPKILAEQEAALEKSLQRRSAAWSANQDSLVSAVMAADREQRRVTLSTIDFEISELARADEEKKLALDKHASNYADAYAAIERETATKMGAARRIHNDELRKMSAEADTWSNRLTTLLGAVPGLLKSAFTGGGGIGGFGKALTAQIGESLLGKGAESLLNKGIRGLFNKGLASVSTVSKLAGFAGPLAGMIGSLAAPLLGKLGSGIKKLFGFGGGESKEDKAATAKVREFQNELLKTHGSMSNLRELGKLAGADIATSFGAKGQKGLEKFGKDLEAFNTKVGAWSAQVNADLASIGAQAEGLGFRLTPALQPYIDKLREMGVLTADNQRLLASFGDDSVIDFQKMEEAATGLGIHFDSLGHGFNTAKFNASAGQVLEWLDILERGGADMNAVLSGAADEVSELAQRSMRLGISMPENLRSIVEELIRKGELLDATGEKITDINRLSFGDPIKVGLERIGDLLEKLLTGLGIELPKAIRAIPRAIDIDVNYRENGRPNFDQVDLVDAGGGDYTNNPTFDVPGAAAGGLFTKPTFRVIAEREPEIVGSPNVIASAIAAALGQSGLSSQREAQFTTVVVNVPVGADANTVIDAVTKQLPRLSEMNRNHFRTAFRDAVGLTSLETKVDRYRGDFLRLAARNHLTR